MKFLTMVRLNISIYLETAREATYHDGTIEHIDLFGNGKGGDLSLIQHEVEAFVQQHRH